MKEVRLTLYRHSILFYVGAIGIRQVLLDSIQMYGDIMNSTIHVADILLTPDFINSNIADLTREEREARWPGWVQTFATACRTEKDFFDLASPGNFSAYNIVSDGMYMICGFRAMFTYIGWGLPLSPSLIRSSLFTISLPQLMNIHG